MVSKENEDFYDKYLQSEIILYCLKKCINGRHLSPDIKVKILSLMYSGNDSFEETMESQSTTYSTTIKTEDATLKNHQEVLNLLGIDEDILNESSEKLTIEEQSQLKDCVLEELVAFHKFCTALNSQVETPSVDGKISDSLDNLEEHILKETLLLENFVELQNSVQNVKVHSCMAFNEIINTVIHELTRLKHTGSKLLEEIDQALMDGDKKHYLEKAEKILEDKIAKDKERIEQLKLELMELNIEY